MQAMNSSFFCRCKKKHFDDRIACVRMISAQSILNPETAILSWKEGFNQWKKEWYRTEK